MEVVVEDWKTERKKHRPDDDSGGTAETVILTAIFRKRMDERKKMDTNIIEYYILFIVRIVCQIFGFFSFIFFPFGVKLGAFVV